MNRRLTLVALAAAMLCAAQLSLAQSTWPTLHRDNQRSGWTDEVLRGPFERKWFRNLAEEMVGPRVEAIVAEGKVSVGTYAGNLYAFNVADGETAWVWAGDGAIGHSPCYDDGKLYVCTDDAVNAGRLVCLDAATGDELWSYQAGAGIFNSPATDGERVYVGDRAGVFHAVDAATGEGLWTYQTGYMILKPASISADGSRVVVGSEDMHVYCFGPTGELLWRSAKLPGLSLRDQAPTIWGERVIVRTNPSRAFHEALAEGRVVVNETQRSLGLQGDERVMKNTENNYYVTWSQRRERAEYEAVLEHLRENPSSQTFHVLNLSDGEQPFIATVMFTVGMHNPASPPTFNPETLELYTLLPTAVSPYCDGVSQLGTGVGRLDYETGYMHNIAHDRGTNMPGYFGGFPMISDETSILTLMGDFLVVTHMGAVGGVDLESRRCRMLYGARDTYGLIFGPGAAPGGFDGARRLAAEGYVMNAQNEWHGPDRSAAAIADGRFFYVVGGQVICFAGRDVEATASGGPGAPEPFEWDVAPRIRGGNVTGPYGQFDSSVPRPSIGEAEIAALISRPIALDPAVDADIAAIIRPRLDAAVSETISEDWAPLVVQQGIAHTQTYFWRTAEAMITVSRALPYLSPEVRAEAIAWLDAKFDAGWPIRTATTGDAGRRREHHDLIDEAIENHRGRPPQGYRAGAYELYALWAYAHYADRWDRVAPLAEGLREAFNREFAGMRPFDPDANQMTGVIDLNQRIAGAIGYARIMNHAGNAAGAQQAQQTLGALLAERVRYEQAEGRLTGPRDHQGRLPRYLDLCPELGQILAARAQQPLLEALDAYDRELDVWHMAWGERLVGGENYINPPTVARSIFAAVAYGRGDSAEVLLTRVDQPWCKADLYYIEKLTAVMEAATQ